MTQADDLQAVEKVNGPQTRIVPRRRQIDSRLEVPNQSKRILNHLAIVVIAFGSGLGAGLLMYPEFFSGALVDPDSHDQSTESHHDEGLIELTPQAVANLGLEMGHVELGDFWKTQSCPGEVVEVPGQSDLSVAAPVTGVVEQVDVRVGQAVATGQQLFVLRITDRDLTTAQSELLDLLTLAEIKQTEIERLAPLARDGAVSGTRKRDLEYELSSLTARKQAKVQEILARGLPQQAVDELRSHRTLTTRLVISIPRTNAKRGRSRAAQSARFTATREWLCKPVRIFAILPFMENSMSAARRSKRTSKPSQSSPIRRGRSRPSLVTNITQVTITPPSGAA